MTTHTVILTRHAKAASTAPGTDDKRPLSDLGVAQAKELGVKLSDKIKEVDTVFVSPALRAQQTWDAMAEGAGLAQADMPRVRVDQVLYSGSPEQILQAVRLESTGYSSLVIGHEPTISATAVLMVREGEASEVQWGMPTGSAVILEWSRNWKEWHSHVATITDLVHVPVNR